jgi:hypothetical protein
VFSLCEAFVLHPQDQKKRKKKKNHLFASHPSVNVPEFTASTISNLTPSQPFPKQLWCHQAINRKKS